MPTDLKNFSRNFWREFILLYRDEPCLWLIKSKDYNDKFKKAISYEKLAVKLREIDPSATKETVVKKINNLRTSYRREWNKVNQSIQANLTGSGNGVYVPILWYYNLLSFLSDQEGYALASGKEDGYEHEDANINQLKEEVHERRLHYQSSAPTWQETQPTEYEQPHGITQQQPNEIGEASAYCELGFTQTSSDEDQSVDPPQTKKRKRSSDQNKVTQALLDHLISSNKEDEFDLIGKIVAVKLRNVTHEQKIYAEKYIHEILFEAEFGNLNKNWRFEPGDT